MLPDGSLSFVRGLWLDAYKSTWNSLLRQPCHRWILKHLFHSGCMHNKELPVSTDDRKKWKMKKSKMINCKSSKSVRSAFASVHAFSGTVIHTLRQHTKPLQSRYQAIKNTILKFTIISCYTEIGLQYYETVYIIIAYNWYKSAT